MHAQGLPEYDEHTLVDRWKCLSEWTDVVFPEFGPFETDQLKEGMVFWDLLLTKLLPLFVGRTCSRKGAVARQALVMAAKGVVVYTLAPHQALVRQGYG